MTNSRDPRPAARPPARPSEGGSYIRQPDGSLMRVDQVAPADPPAQADGTEKSSRTAGQKPAPKPPVKEA